MQIGCKYILNLQFVFVITILHDGNNIIHIFSPILIRNNEVDMATLTLD